MVKPVNGLLSVNHCVVLEHNAQLMKSIMLKMTILRFTCAYIYEPHTRQEGVS